MKFMFILKLVLAMLLTSAGFATDQQIPNLYTKSRIKSIDLVKKHALADLDLLYNMFEIKYAPLKWKEAYAQPHIIDTLYQNARAQLSALQKTNLKQCQIILRDFCNHICDYHVGIRFYSTELATLPFTVKGADGRYFISFIDHKSLKTKVSFCVGDEIISFGGSPIHTVIEELKQKECGGNTPETDQAIAELILTKREGTCGHTVPSGNVSIVCKSKSNGELVHSNLVWNYTPELIRDCSQFGKKISLSVTRGKTSTQLAATLNDNPLFNKLLVAHFWEGPSVKTNPYEPGSRESFIPPLGVKLWTTAKLDLFDAYLFLTPQGKRIGYIRIPHYSGDNEDVEVFGEIMNLFEEETDALVIDQINNPGGSLFYLYALASIFAKEPMEAPKHHIALTQEEVAQALTILPALELVVDDLTAHLIIGKTIGGYPIDFDFALSLKEFCTFLINQWDRGHICTDPIFVFGARTIKPHPQYRYTKPILLLIDQLDFSGGDFFPAIMQDNHRARLLGVRTAGAGGYITSVHFPNQLGISRFTLTASLAKRSNQKPIENLGVEPDIFYAPTDADLQGNYEGYVDAILKAVDDLLRPR